MKIGIEDFIRYSVEKIGMDEAGQPFFHMDEKNKHVAITKHFDYYGRRIQVQLSFGGFRGEQELNINISIPHTKTKEDIVRGMTEVVMVKQYDPNTRATAN